MQEASFRANLGKLFDVDAGEIFLSITIGSVLVHSTIVMPTAASADAAAEYLLENDPESLSRHLDFSVFNVSGVHRVPIAMEAPSSPPSSPPLPLLLFIALLIIAIGVAAATCTCVFRWRARHAQKRRVPPPPSTGLEGAISATAVTVKMELVDGTGVEVAEPVWQPAAPTSSTPSGIEIVRTSSEASPISRCASTGLKDPSDAASGIEEEVSEFSDKQEEPGALSAHGSSSARPSDRTSATREATKLKRATVTWGAGLAWDRISARISARTGAGHRGGESSV